MPTTELPPALAAWADLPGPSKVIAAVRKRALAGHSTERGKLNCALDPAERKQVGRLLGNTWEVSGKPVKLEAIAAHLSGLTLWDLAEAVGGEITPKAEQRARDAADAAAERARAVQTLTTIGLSDDVVDTWLSDPGLPRPGTGDLAGLTTSVARVWTALSDTPVHLAQLAADTCGGDAHALDSTQPLGRAVARLAAGAHGLQRPQRTGSTWRAAWAAIGVLCNEVSSRVLTLNLALDGPAPAARLTAVAQGEPLWLTLRSLAGTWKPTAPGPVYVCENPTIVEAAADQLGPRCPPLICTDGIASAAALALVEGLASMGCPIHARADFDRAGFTIMDQLRTVAPALTPWRFDALTYASASSSTAVPMVFDPQGITEPIHEEALLGALLDDLSAAAGNSELGR